MMYGGQVAPTGYATGPSFIDMQWIMALLFNRPGTANSFDGRAESFLPFIAFFDSTVCRHVADPMFRLKNLIDSCTPTIQNQLAHCMLLPPKLGFARAWQMLWEDYGHRIYLKYPVTMGHPISSSTKSLLD